MTRAVKNPPPHPASLRRRDLFAGAGAMGEGAANTQGAARAQNTATPKPSLRRRDLLAGSIAIAGAAALARLGLAAPAHASLTDVAATPIRLYGLSPAHEQVLRETLGAIAASPRAQTRQPAEVEAGLARLHERYVASTPDVQAWVRHILDGWREYARDHGWTEQNNRDRLRVLRTALSAPAAAYANDVASYATLAYVDIDAKPVPLYL